MKTKTMACLLILLFNHALCDVKDLFVEHGVVPDVISEAPLSLAKIRFDSGVSVNGGNELTPTQVRDIPYVDWNGNPEHFYTLIMTDPDAPSRSAPSRREFHHWLVGNIQGVDLSSGETLSEYIGSGPPANTGLHRYVILIFKQPGLLRFDERRLNNKSRDGRAKFSTAKFAAKYNLGAPFAGNFFQAQFDSYVPILHKQLG